jgi:DNA polymerase-3 subunit alpha
MSGFLQAYQNTRQHGLKLIYGLRITICDDITEKNEQSLKTNNKIVIFVKNAKGYKSLIKIYSRAARDGFYYEPRTDYSGLKEHWNEEGLSLVIPFYDSFVHRNLLENALCVPEFSFTNPRFFVEDNGIPFDSLTLKAVNKITSNGKKNKITKTKSIYYNRREDFKAYLTFRCINKRATLDKPNIDHMTSDEFCLESWKETAHA